MWPFTKRKNKESDAMSEGEPFQPAASHKDAPQQQPANETADDLDALIADADGACEAVAAKCAHVSESDAARQAEMAQARQSEAKARQEVEQERGFRTKAEQERDKAIEALKRVTKRLKEVASG